MRLGIHSSNYARLFGAGPPAAPGAPPLYFPQLEERVPEDESLAWCLRRAHRLGVPVVADQVRRWRDAEYVRRTAELARETGIAVEPWMVIDYVGGGEAAKRGIEEVIAFMRAVCRPFGASILGTAQSPIIYHRWRADPPLDEQLERYAENLKPVAQAAAEEGVTLALENHVDYWAEELLRVKARVGSPALRFRFDTANQWLVMQDPLHAVELLAGDVVTVHLKDVRIVPLTPEGARVIGAPLGQGHVDFKRILGVLKERSPAADTLPLVVETHFVPPNEDRAYWSEAGVAWAQQALAEFLS